jgi:hypothetical protein
MPDPFHTVSQPNIWNTEFLEEDDPRFLYGAFKPERGVDFPGAPRSFFDYYQNRQAQVEGGYFAQQGRLARSGQPPSGTRVDFMGNFPWMQRWLALSPEQRGVTYAPAFRWNIPR